MHTVPIYRLWNGSSRDHLYSTNPNEGQPGYAPEGLSFYAYSHPGPNLAPLLRYWSDRSKDHLYTLNPSEIGTQTVGVTGNHGYKYEGSLGYLSPTSIPNSQPVYRYWNPSTLDHLYTTKQEEIGTIVNGQKGNHGYVSEGVLGYAAVSPVPSVGLSGSSLAFSNPNPFPPPMGSFPPQNPNPFPPPMGTFPPPQNPNPFPPPMATFPPQNPNPFPPPIATFPPQNPNPFPPPIATFPPPQNPASSMGLSGSGTGTGTSSGQLIPIYRYWNSTIRDHFYTNSATEIATAHGFVSEGVPFRLSPLPGNNLTPVYRYYVNGDHLYTTDPKEIGTTTPGQKGLNGYVFESILGYIGTVPSPGQVPVFRYYSPGAKDHFYTTNVSEIGQSGGEYFNEGVLGFAWL